MTDAPKPRREKGTGMSLEEALGIDMSDPSQRLALELVEQDAALVRGLRDARKRTGLTIEQVAERAGVKPATVSQFERYDSDPPLSLIRRYAHAIGTSVRHEIDEPQ